MELGVLLPHAGRAAGPAALRQVATRAEEMGCSSLWVGDHVGFPATQRSRYPYNEEGMHPVTPDGPFYEAFSTLSYVAALTQRAALGVTVCIAPYRPAALLAKVVGTLSALSTGEVILGVGAGWLEEEFEALGASYRTRHRTTDEVVAYLRAAAFEDGPVAMAEDGADGIPMHINPGPPRSLQIWIGGNGPRARRRAGQLGDLWHPTLTGKSPDALVAEMEDVRGHAAARGRRSEEVGLSLFVPVRLESSAEPRPWEKGEVCGPAEYVADVLRSYEEVGVTHVVLSMGGGPDRRLRGLEALLGAGV